MSVWFTSDLHLHHLLVAQQRAERMLIPGLESDPANILAWHDELLARNWDMRIKPTDQVWVLGDISSGHERVQGYALSWLANRPGEKHLIPGNHCRVHPMHRDSHKWFAKYMEVFKSIQPYARRKIGAQRVLLSHFPYEYDHTMEDRYTQYRLPDEGLPIIHGHTHKPWRATASTPIYRVSPSTVIKPNQFHVGLDAWNLCPVHIDQLAELMDKGE